MATIAAHLPLGSSTAYRSRSSSRRPTWRVTIHRRPPSAPASLLLDIRLLVADEIISMLDASTRIDVLNLLGDLKARGLGILFITHDLSLGNYISDTAVILHRGEVVETGPTGQVFDQPRHPYTRSLLASVPQLHRKWERNGHPVREPAGEGD